MTAEEDALRTLTNLPLPSIVKSLGMAIAEAQEAEEMPQIKRLDFVRIMSQKAHKFAKGTDKPPISRECFQVVEVKPANIRDIQKLPMYRLRDLSGELIIGERNNEE